MKDALRNCRSCKILCGFCQQLQVFRIVQASFEHLIRTPTRTWSRSGRCTAETLGENVWIQREWAARIDFHDFLGDLLHWIAHVCVHFVVPMLRLSELAGLSTPGLDQSDSVRQHLVEFSPRPHSTLCCVIFYLVKSRRVCVVTPVWDTIRGEWVDARLEEGQDGTRNTIRSFHRRH